MYYTVFFYQLHMHLFVASRSSPSGQAPGPAPSHNADGGELATADCSQAFDNLGKDSGLASAAVLLEEEGGDGREGWGDEAKLEIDEGG